MTCVRQALAPVEIESQEAAEELAEDLGLPLTISGTGLPAQFPTVAPFSRAVPAIVHALRRQAPMALGHTRCSQRLTCVPASDCASWHDRGHPLMCC